MADVSNNPKYQTTDTRKTVRLPLYGLHLNRSSSTDKDQRYINCFPETTKNTVTDLRKFFLVKRPGTTLNYNIGVTGEGRGVWYWNGNYYSVIGNKIYENTVAIQTLNTITGTCGGIVCMNPLESLFICDGIDGYIIDTDGNIENVEKAYLRWTASSVLEIGDKRIPTISNGYYYTVSSVTGNKETNTTEPTWPTTIGNTVVDNEITWTCTSTYSGATKRTNNTIYTVGDIITPTTENSLFYTCTTGGTSAASQPTMPTTIGETVTDGTVTWKCSGYYGGFPSPHIPQPILLNGYLCLAESNSIDMYNSDTVDVFSWNPLNFISAESFSDPIRGLARQNNYIVAFGDTNTEMFYDAANTTGSPFSRNESFLLQTGILSTYTVMQTEKLCMWLGKSDAGKSAVWMLDGFSPKEISTEYIEKIINAETDIENIFGYGLRVAGHFFYILNLPTLDKTLVYDIEEALWHEWSYGNSALPFNHITTIGQKVLLLHSSNGKIYELDETAYSDFDTDITVSIVTAKYDFDTNKRKFIYKTEVVGDLVDSNISLSWSDDDYQSWSNTKTLFLLERPYFMRGGFTRRRAFKLIHEDAVPLRLEFIEIIYTMGKH